MRHAPLLALAAMLAASPALGQSPAAAPTTTPAPTAQPRPPTERVERHIADLQRKLAITPAQQPHWDAFAAILRQNAQRTEASYAERQARPATLTAVEDLRAHAAMERARAEDSERMLPAFERLYASMSPEQRASADKLFRDHQRGPRRRG